MEFSKKIVQVGGSLGFVLPKPLLDYFSLELGSEILITDDEDKIIIIKSK